MSGSPSTCTARPATPDDFGEIAALLQRIFGVRRSVESLRWKFGGGSGLPAGSAVLTDNRRIVGFLGQIPARIVVMGHETQAAQGADVGILEEYRRLDAYLGLVRVSVRAMEKARITVTYGVANAEASSPLSELLGQPRVSRLPLLIRPLCGGIAPAAGRTRRRCMRMLASLVNVGVYCATPRPDAAGDGLQTVHLDRFDDRFDRFWRGIRDDYPIMLVRDAAFLNWRYGPGSGVAYERIAIQSAVSGHIEGYAVLSVSGPEGTLRGRLCDLITPRHGNPRVAHRLMAASVKWLRDRQVDIADAWMFPHTHLHPILRRHGFVPRRTNPGGFHAGALGTAAPRLPGVNQAGNWFLSMGDSDTV